MHAFRPAGISAKIDEQLKLSQAIDKAGAKVEELKGSVTSKVCHAPHAPRHALLESATAPPPLPAACRACAPPCCAGRRAQVQGVGLEQHLPVRSPHGWARVVGCILSGWVFDIDLFARSRPISVGTESPGIVSEYAYSTYKKVIRNIVHMRG